LGLSAGQILDRALAINGGQLQAMTMQKMIAVQGFLHQWRMITSDGK
jgi:hypothetical protein